MGIVYQGGRLVTSSFDPLFSFPIRNGYVALNIDTLNCSIMDTRDLQIAPTIVVKVTVRRDSLLTSNGNPATWYYAALPTGIFRQVATVPQSFLANPIKGYYFFLSQSGNCTVTSDTILYQTTGLFDAQQLSGITISPNPNLGLFTIEFSVPTLAQTTLRISDGAGRILMEKQLATNSRKQIIEAPTLQAGMYFVQIVVKGKIIAIEKFVKQ